MNVEDKKYVLKIGELSLQVLTAPLRPNVPTKQKC